MSDEPSARRENTTERTTTSQSPATDIARTFSTTTSWLDAGEPGLVSIVIVCHNNWPDLELAIESSLHQSWTAVEVIVVDNDSSDTSQPEVARLYGQAVRYVRQPNRGAGSGYNTGVRNSRGEFIQLLEGDDALAPNKIAKQIETFRAVPEADIVYGPHRAFFSNAGEHCWSDAPCGEQEDMLAALLSETNPVAGLATHSTLYRRAALNRLGPWDETLTMTIEDLWLRAAWEGLKFAYCPGGLAFYRRHEGQMSSRADVMLKGGEAVLQKALQYIDRPSYRAQIVRRIARIRFAIARTGGEPLSSFRELLRARSMAPEAISRRAVAAAALMVFMPSLGTMLRGPEWSALRSRFRSALKIAV